jgi:hypothetical protein
VKTALGKDYVAKELDDIADIIKGVSSDYKGNVAWQNSYIKMSLSRLIYAKDKLQGLIKAIKTEFKS